MVESGDYASLYESARTFENHASRWAASERRMSLTRTDGPPLRRNAGLAATAMNDGNDGDGARWKHTESRRVT